MASTSTLFSIPVRGTSNTYIDSKLKVGDELSFIDGFIPVDSFEDASWHRENHPAVSGQVLSDGFDYVRYDFSEQWAETDPAYIVAVQESEVGPIRLYGATVHNDVDNCERVILFHLISEFGESGKVKLRA